MKKKRMILVIMLVVIFLCTSCGTESSKSAPSVGNAPTQEESYGDELGAIADKDLAEGGAQTSNTASGSEKSQEEGKSENSNQKLVYTSQITVETKKYDDALSSLRKSISKYKGIIESENENKDSVIWGSNDMAEVGERRNELTIRIPTENYEKFLQGVEGLGVVTEKSSNVENITKSYHDTSTRIEALKRQEKRVLKMMDEAKTISEMITVEKRLTEIQTELDMYKNQLSVMDMDVAYSTITLTLREVEKEKPTVEPSFASRFGEAFADSFERFISVIQGLAIMFVYFLPYFIFIGAITAVILLILKATSKKKSGKKKIEKKIEKPEKNEEKKN